VWESSDGWLAAWDFDECVLTRSSTGRYPVGPPFHSFVTYSFPSFCDPSDMLACMLD